MGRQQSVWKTDFFFSAKCIRRVVCPGNKNNRIFFGWNVCRNASHQDNRQCFRIFDSDVGYPTPPISIFYKITIRLVSPTTGLFGQLFVVRTWFLRNNLAAISTASFHPCSCSINPFGQSTSIKVYEIQFQITRAIIIIVILFILKKVKARCVSKYSRCILQRIFLNECLWNPIVAIADSKNSVIIRK